MPDPKGWVPSTPLEVVEQLTALTAELRDLVEELGRADAAQSKAQRDYDLAEARAYLDAVGTIPQRKAWVTLECGTVAEALAIADTRLRLVKARVREVETRIEVGRTYGATLRAEFATMGLSGGQGR